jgi:hypothetical protein
MPDPVFLSVDSVKADMTPQFIIQVGDVYYVSMAVWAYDMALATDAEQGAGVQMVTDKFADLQTAGPTYVAVIVPGGAGGDDWPPSQTQGP